MSDKVSGMDDMMERTQQIQQQLALARSELIETQVTGTAGDRMVAITMRGDGEVTDVKFAREAIDQGAESLAAMTLAAFRQAADEVKSVTAAKLAALTSTFEAEMERATRGFRR